MRETLSLMEYYWLRPVLGVLSRMSAMATKRADEEAERFFARACRAACYFGCTVRRKAVASFMGECTVCGGDRVTVRDDSDPAYGYYDPLRPWCLDCRGWAD